MSRARDIANLQSGSVSFSSDLTVGDDIVVTNATPTFKFTDTDNNYDATIQGLSGSLVLTADSGAEFGTETIQFKTGGSQNMTLDASGNLGIGDTSPSNRLSVVAADGDADNAYVATFQNQEATDDRNYGVLIKAGSTATDSALVVTDHDASNNLFFVKGNGKTFIAGNVGIGTTTIGDKLVVQGTASATESIIIQDPTANDYGTHLSFDDANSKAIFGGITNGTKNPALRVTRDAASGIDIDSSGNVGIGITSPSSYNSGSDNLVVGGTSGDNGITIATGTTNGGLLAFADGTSGNAAYRGYIQYDHNTDFLAVGSAGTERMRIDSSGRVGIGVTPQAISYSTGAESVQFGASFLTHFDTTGSGTTSISNNVWYDGTNNKALYYGYTSQYYQSSGNHIWRSSAITSAGGNVTLTERMRIDSSGNLLVGTTDTSLYNNSGSGEGLSYFPSQFLTVATYQQETAIFNRLSNDGTIVQFRKDGATVGIIGVGGSSAQPVIGSNNATAGGTAAGLRFDRANNSIQPWNVVSNASADDTIDLGYSSIRFDDIYATNGTIQTSDENEKQDIASMTTAELAVGKRLSTLFKTFRWKSKVTEKANKARTHSGIIAQEVKAAFEAEGLDATKYALFCSDTWTNDDGKEQTRMGVRYPELLSFIASYNESRFTAIEARIAKLEG